MGRNLEYPETPQERRSVAVGFFMMLAATVAVVGVPIFVFSDMEIPPYLDTFLEKLAGGIAAEFFLTWFLLQGVYKMLDGHYRED